MSSTQTLHVILAFEDRRHAQAAIAELRDVGFREDQIGLAVRQPGGELHQPQSDDTYAAEGSAIGAAAGAGIGGLWAIGIAAGLLPAVGPVVAGGILGSLLASAAGGAAVGGLAGALGGMGVPEEDRDFYEQEFRCGQTIVAVKANGRCDEAQKILQRHGGFGLGERQRD